uniref:Coiled-coil domain-containing protein 86 n=1 Tax=Phallusia mammillata TaxID=59560 RepID=A0A6F9D9F7_9ASCI|nr:coiled-coil domain-containing protein 86-like [Phallusia mammillata]
MVVEGEAKEVVKQQPEKGIPKSGRWWKSKNTSRFSSLPKDKPLRSSWHKKSIQRAEKLSLKQYQQKVTEARRQEKIEHRQRVEAHRKRKEENQRKSEIVQVIKNTAKIKRMKKKQLRKIEKRDTNNLKVKSQ